MTRHMTYSRNCPGARRQPDTATSSRPAASSTRHPAFTHPGGWARWRAALFSTAAAGALCAAAAPAAAGPQPCTVGPANVATCQGNQSAGIRFGIDFGGPVDTLQVNNLTQNINAGVGGIVFNPGTFVPPTFTLISNTGNFSIISQGEGIQLNTVGAQFNVDHTGNISAQRSAIFVDSIGTGATNAGDVTVSMTGNVSAGGDGIRALSSISDPGSTGNAGNTSVTSTGNIVANRSGVEARSSAVGPGNAGAVAVKSAGNISARDGIIATSEVNSGSTGSASTTAVLSKGNINSGNVGISARSTVSLGNGNAGNASVVSVGDIVAKGVGIEAVSSVAGSGNAGTALVFSGGNIGNAQFVGIRASSVADTGNAGSVLVSSVGNIDNAQNGIEAVSSVAGTGNASAVTVDAAGNITSRDFGILARSRAASGSVGDIRVVIRGGTVTGGISGVVFDGGAANALAINSTAAVAGRGNGSAAILDGTGTETIDNSGTVTGRVELGGGNNLFNNFAGALFNAGSIVDLGANGVLSNAGTFAPGGVGTPPITTTLTGNFVQGASGSFAVDASNGGADRVNVSGTAEVAGTVLPTIKGLVAAAQRFTILSAAGGITNNGITVRDTTIIDYELLFPNPNDMVLAVTANFTPGGAALTPNERVTAAHLQSAFNARGGNLGGLFGYLGGFLDAGSYANALDRLHPEPYLAQVQSVLLGNLGLTDNLMNCPTAAGAGVNAYIAEGQCAWARMGGRVLNVDRTTQNIGYEDKTWSASGGVQFALAPSWFGSIAAGYESSDIKVDDRASATGHLFHIGAGAKYINGNWQISGALTGGFASYDTTRFNVMPGVNATGDASLSFLSGRLRAAYVFGSDTAYVKPLVDFDVVGIHRSGIVESSTVSSVGLNVHSQTDTLFSGAPAVEVGGHRLRQRHPVAAIRARGRPGVQRDRSDGNGVLHRLAGGRAGLHGDDAARSMDGRSFHRPRSAEHRRL
jgi:hypothetical protein